VVLSNPTISSENILTLGQSGFIGVGAGDTPEFDPHFNDQLPLYREFQYKPMHLYRNTQLQE
jgi:acyl-homoserine lactone acylase PvdQ